MTTKTVAALRVIKDNPGLSYPRAFGQLYFGKDHPGWRRHTKAGPYGTTHGGGMNMAAGGYLGKLIKRGLVRQGPRRFGRPGIYYVTPAGEAVIAAADQAEVKK